MNQLVLVTLAVTLDVLFIGILLYVFPHANRKDLFFGVTVDPAYTDTTEARLVTQRYKRSIVLQLSAWILLILLVAAFSSTLPIERGTMAILVLLPLASIGLVVGSMIIYMRSRRVGLQHSVKPDGRRVAAITPLPRDRSAISPWYVLGPFLMMGATAFILWMSWSRIPDRYPTHWGVSGIVDGWTTRSVLGVGAPLLVVLPLLLVFTTIALTVPFRARRLHKTGEAANHELSARILMSKLLIGVGYFIALPTCAAALYLPLGYGSQNLPTMLILATLIGDLILLALCVVVVTRAGEHMEKARAAAVAVGEVVIGDRTDDRFWKAGMFYHNPNDAAIWVEKRFGYGWTLNMAHWQGWAFLAAILAIPLAGVLLTIFG